jgi:hypothetical protein
VASYNPVERKVCGVLLSSREEGMWRPIIQWRGRYVASYNPVERKVCGVLLSSREEGMWRPIIQ